MFNQADNISDTVFIQEEVSNSLMQEMERLLNVRKQLEPENLRECNENSLNRFIVQLQEISKEIRCMPPEATQPYVTSRNALLKYLHNAFIELVLALDHFTTKGRTSRFYKLLSKCQEYLESAYECKIDEPILKTIRLFDKSEQSSGNFFTQSSSYYTYIVAAQASLEEVYELLLEDDNIQVDRYDHTVTILGKMSIPIRELCRLLNENTYFSGEASTLYYQLRVNLYYVDEQIQELIALIRTFRSIYRSSQKQARKASQEIYHKLELLIRSSNDLPNTITALLDQQRFQIKSNYRLRLIPSLGNA
jgi:hypothetical protein